MMYPGRMQAISPSIRYLPPLKLDMASVVPCDESQPRFYTFVFWTWTTSSWASPPAAASASACRRRSRTITRDGQGGGRLREVERRSGKARAGSRAPVSASLQAPSPSHAARAPRRASASPRELSLITVRCEHSPRVAFAGVRHGAAAARSRVTGGRARALPPMRVNLRVTPLHTQFSPLWRSPFLVKKWAEPFGQRVRTYVTHPEPAKAGLHRC